MNLFDSVILLFAVIALITGFRSGLLRSLATIFGYVTATPLAVAVTPVVASAISPQTNGGIQNNSMIFFTIWFVAGFVIGALLRTTVDAAVGNERSLADGLAGAALGMIRVGLVAVTLVLVFDRLIPPGRDPEFLAGSQLRPILLVAGQRGLNALPPQTTAYIDQIKRGQRI